MRWILDFVRQRSRCNETCNGVSRQTLEEFLRHSGQVIGYVRNFTRLFNKECLAESTETANRQQLIIFDTHICPDEKRLACRSKCLKNNRKEEE